MVIYEYPPLGGGGGVSARWMAEALVQHHGWNVTVLTAGVGKSVTDNFMNGVHVIRLPCARKRKDRSSASMLFMMRFVWETIFFAFKVRTTMGVDIVHSWFALPSGLGGIFAARFWKVPHVVTMIGGEVFEQPLELELHRSMLYRVLNALVIRYSQSITAISHDVADGTRRLLQLKREVHVLPLGVPIQKGVKLCMEEKSGVFSMIAVSRLVPRKDFETLFRALALLKRENWTLSIIGDGPEKTRLEHLAIALGIEKQVRFLGYVDDTVRREMLASSDLFVSSTLHEGFGLMYLEAMEVGLPIVTTDNGGQNDILHYPRNALLVPVRNPAALAAAILRSWDDTAWRKSAGKANQEDVEDFDILAVSPKYNQYLRGCLSELY